jgi:hypothetical protein
MARTGGRFALTGDRDHRHRDTGREKNLPGVDSISRRSSYSRRTTGGRRPRAGRDEESDMRFMVIVKADKDSEAGAMPDERLLGEMQTYNEALADAGVMLSGEGLHPSSKGARVRFPGRQRTVVDGPFAETKELVAGFWIFQTGSLQEAIDWVKRCPNPGLGESEIEIRQIFESDEFGEAMTPELRAAEDRLRDRLTAKS